MSFSEILALLPNHAYELVPDPSPDSPFVLVFIHGWLLSRSYWKPVIDQLSTRYPCLGYDLPGFGNSYLICQDDYSPMGYAKQLELLLNQLNISKVWLVGHSLGGTIALWGAYQMRDRVLGVICLNAGGGIYVSEAFLGFREAAKRMLKLRPNWLCYLPLCDFLFSRMAVAYPITRLWAHQRLVDFVRADYNAALEVLLQSTTEEQINLLPKIVSELKQPVYFMAGEEDLFMEPQYVRHLASFHYLFQELSSNVIEIPNCGYLAMLEQPMDVVDGINKIILESQIKD